MQIIFNHSVPVLLTAAWLVVVECFRCQIIAVAAGFRLFIHGLCKCNHKFRAPSVSQCPMSHLEVILADTNRDIAKSNKEGGNYGAHASYLSKIHKCNGQLGIHSYRKSL